MNSTLGFDMGCGLQSKRRLGAEGKSQRPHVVCLERIAAEERKKRTLGVRLGESRGMAAGVSNSGSWHRATRASLENVAFQTFIEFCRLRLNMTRSESTSDQAEGCIGDSNQNDLVLTLFFISSATFIEPRCELVLRSNSGQAQPLPLRGGLQFS